jgi:hypothetical protein
MAARLISGGFVLSGRWELDPGSRPRFIGEAPIQPGAYAFSVDGDVSSVGSAQRGIARRMNTYEKTETKRTAYRVRGLIAQELSVGRSVEVLTIVPGTVRWNGLPLDLAAGLEQGIICEFRPRWNIRGLGMRPLALEICPLANDRHGASEHVRLLFG